MDNKNLKKGLSRRDFLKAGGMSTLHLPLGRMEYYPSVLKR